MKTRSGRAGSISGKVVLLAIGLAALFWILDAGVNAFVFHQGTFAQQILTSDLNEIWLRSAGVLTLIGLGTFLDFALTSRRRTREQQKESEKRYRELADSLPQTLFETDETGKLTFLNRHAFQSSRYSLADFDKGLNVLELIVPEDRDRAKQDILTALSGQELDGLEYTAVKKDGGSFPVIMYVAPISRGDALVGLRGVLVDITERKRAEKALQESEERLRILFEYAPDAYYLNDLQGIFVDGNKAAETMTGYKKEELVGKSFLSLHLLPPDQIANAASLLAHSALGRATGPDEFTFNRKDGRQVAMEIRTFPVEIKGTVLVLGIARDVSLRKSMEGQLQLRAKLLDAASDLIFLNDLAGNFVYVNETACKAFGYSKHEFADLNLRNLDLSTDVQYTESRMNELTEKGEATFEVTAFRKDNTVIPLEVHARIIKSDGDEHILTVARDITERRKTQEQLQHSQLMVSLGEMTAGIAHEVNNPLGSILLYSELLMAGDVPPQIRKDLKVVRDEAKRATRIMTNLLTYGRKAKPQTRRVNLNRVLGKVLDMRQYEQRVRNILVSRELVDGPVYINGDFSQLMQVFMNIILNAEEALEESNGGTITLTTELDSHWARVSIADDGVGIPGKDLRQVFYPFFTTKGVGEGTGLGLSTCYGIVTSHNGLIRAENNDVGGATFIVELPLLKSTQQPKSSPQKTDGEIAAIA